MRVLVFFTAEFAALAFTAVTFGQINYEVPFHTPTIDGIVTAGEMSQQLPTFIGYPEIEETGGTLVVAQSGTEHENVSATFYTSWDETNLYISAVALDNTPYYDCCDSGGPMNANDIIQPMFNPNNDHDAFFPPDPGGGPGAIYDVAVETRDEFGPDIYRHGALFKDGQRDQILDGGLAGTIQVDANGDQIGYTLELALPWSIAMDDVNPAYIPQVGDEHGYGFLMIGEEFGSDPTLLWDAGEGVNTIGDLTTWNQMTLVPQLGDPCDYDGDGSLGLGDVNILSAAIFAGDTDSKFDVNDDSRVDRNDLNFFIGDSSKLDTWIGDANLDGEFNSSDLVRVFSGGKYETDGPATWDEGDWNADRVFNSGDMVAAFSDGGYEKGLKSPAAVPEPSAIIIAGIGLLAVLRFRSVRS
ncbi:MAG: PEP-CTERM sorting domain-containing protein [Planctomycetaceae bacterium]|nr:PEP-CTERM sorting domain-containing protein [Planctomycetaceae bacterium]